MSRLGILAKDTAIYGISSILGRMLNWLLVPVYTAFLAPSSYGIVTELYAYVAFLVILYTYGMETAYFRFSTNSEDGEEKHFNLSQSSTILTTLFLSSLLIAFAGPLTQHLEYPGRERYVIWFAIILAIDAITAIPFARLRLQGKARKFAAVKLINIFLNIGLNLFFIVFCTHVMRGRTDTRLYHLISSFFNQDQLVDYIFISNLIANAFVLILLGDIIFRFRFRLDKDVLKKMYWYALPIMVMGLAGVTNEMLSRAVLKKWLPEGFYSQYSNQAALGIFGAAYKLSVFMTLAIQAFRYAAEPFFFSRAKDLDGKALFSKVLHWFIIFGSLVLVIISLNLDLIGQLFLRSAPYREGLVVVPVLLLANLFLGIYYNLSVWFKLTDRTYFGTLIAIIGAIATIIMNYLLIPAAGYMGSAMATLACYMIMTFLSYRIGRHFYPVDYQTGRGLLIIFMAALVTYLGYYTNPFIGDPVKWVQLFMILLFVLFVLLLEKKELSQLFKKYFKK